MVQTLQSPVTPGDPFLASTDYRKVAASIASACVVGKFLSPRLLMRAWGERVSVTSGTGSRVVTGTVATDRAGDAILREQGTRRDYGPVQ